MLDAFNYFYAKDGVGTWRNNFNRKQTPKRTAASDEKPKTKRATRED